MKRIDGKNSVDGKFIDRNSIKGIPGTECNAKWYNNIQEEIVNTIEQSGQTPSDGNQLELAIKKIIGLTMSKVKFDANCNSNKLKYNGSGFTDFGYTSRSVNKNVNVGLWEDADKDYTNTLFMGNLNKSSIGHPIVTVNGVTHHLNRTSGTDDWVDQCNMKFPPAPDGTKTYDSATAKVVDYMKDVDPKYGDVASTHNEAVSRAFEGMVKNGDFRLGTAGWTTWGSVISVMDGKLTIEGGAGSRTTKTYHSVVSFKKGITYQFSFYLHEFNSNVRVISSNSDIFPMWRDYEGTGLHTFTFTPTGDVTYGKVQFESTKNNSHVVISNVSICPVTENVITSRKDLAFLETWHEDIGEKDIVYPLGNVQCDKSDWNGITLKNDLIAQGYSAYGEWDTETKGHGVKWYTLTFEQKANFTQDPKNNIYFDSKTGKFIQVRYRVRVVEGYGDEWWNIQASNLDRDFAYATLTLCVTAKGAKDTTPEFVNTSSGFKYTYNRSDDPIGTFHVHPSGEVATGNANALPIALVQRMNQGAYHPVYNPSGCSKIFNSSNASNYDSWYVANRMPINSVMDCFDFGNFPNTGFTNAVFNSGCINKVGSGRPSNDPYQYHDVIYAGQVEDLRLSAHKQNDGKLLTDSIRKAVAGEMRGKGKVPFLHKIAKDLIQKTSATYSQYIWLTSDYDMMNNIKVGDYISVYREDLTTIWNLVCVTKKDSDGVFCNDAPVFVRTTGEKLVVSHYSLLTPEYDNLPWTDIIGSPENIEKTFPNGVVGQWIPQIPTLQTDDIYQLNAKSTSNGGSVFWTGDNGTSWTSASAIINNTSNESNYNLQPNMVGLISYPVLSNCTNPLVNAEDLHLNKFGIMSSSHKIEEGNRLQYSLIGAIGKDDTKGNCFMSKVASSDATTAHVSTGLNASKLDNLSEIGRAHV